ncbi:MAG: menaquinone biosynthesis decarboxylase [Bacteroidetes bacterium]|nr:menaquinone biosynthesis decarboxylase [Bacteroidota bacterium]
MSYRSLNHFIQTLESAGELVRVKAFVSPILEVTEIADRVVKNNGKALLFENNGTEFPILILAFAGEKRINMALSLRDLDDAGRMIEGMVRDFMGPKEHFLDKLRLLPALQEISSWMPKTLGGRGACQEVVMGTPDLNRLPVLKCWPYDGGPFITLPCVHTRNPENNSRNLGMYRMQVFGPELTGMHWHMHKGSAFHYQLYKKAGKRMPVSVTLGGDPVYTYAATAPLPENLDEYLFAGFLRKKKVELVKCLTNDLEVPADADFVIEGYIDPLEELILEGPFGDHTGFYSLAGMFPRFHVTCITHRKDAVYLATIVGIPPQEDAWIGKATERIFLTPVKLSVVPELTSMHMPPEGVFHNIVLASIHKQYPGQAIKVMSSLWGAGQMMFSKIMAVFDADTVLTDYAGLARLVSRHTDPLQDIHFIQGPVDILDHSSRRYGFGSKIGLDATSKTGEEETDTSVRGTPYIDKNGIMSAIPAITSANTDLIHEGISAVILAIRKTRPAEARAIAKQLNDDGYIRNVGFILFVDYLLDVNNLSTLCWIIANNLDPMRDCFYTEQPDGSKYPVLFVDGTMKSAGMDSFTREWPNVIVMDDQTISTIDSKWNSLGIGSFVASPSLQFKSLVLNDGAVAGPKQTD